MVARPSDNTNERIMQSQEEIDHQLELLQTHRYTLHNYLKQQAIHGYGNVPPSIIHGIHESRRAIQHIKTVLRNWEISVEDAPDDVALSDPQVPSAHLSTFTSEFKADDPSTTKDISAPSLSKLGISISQLEYYCYISESKVNNLYAQLDTWQHLSILSVETPKRIVELRKQIILAQVQTSEYIHELQDELNELELRHSLTSLDFSTRSGANIHRKLAGLENIDVLLYKFRSVLRYIILEKKIQNIEQVVQNREYLEAFCYVYSGPFHFEEFASRDMAILAGQLGDYTLRLYCSMKYFSDMGYFKDESGEWYAKPHSTNFAFFDQKIKPSYRFKSLFFITSIKEQNIIGSPLFLILSSREDISL